VGDLAVQDVTTGSSRKREGGSPCSTVPLAQYIPGSMVEKGGTNIFADTICLVGSGSRPNCDGSCDQGCTSGVKTGKGRVVLPVQQYPSPTIFWFEVEQGGTNIITDTICLVGPGSRPNCDGSCVRGCDCGVKMGKGRMVLPVQQYPSPNICQV